jgi:hypothetical protein
MQDVGHHRRNPSLWKGLELPPPPVAAPRAWIITASFKTLSLQGVADATSGAISFTYVFIKKKKLQKESYGTTMYVIDT